MARLLIVSRSMALAMRLADQHEVTEHPADDLDSLIADLDTDVLVLDVGDAVLAVNTVNALREADKATPVLLVSGYQPEWEQVEAQQVEGVYVVPLPITRISLLVGVAALLGEDVDYAVEPDHAAEQPVPEPAGEARGNGYPEEYADAGYDSETSETHDSETYDDEGSDGEPYQQGYQPAPAAGYEQVGANGYEEGYEEVDEDGYEEVAPVSHPDGYRPEQPDQAAHLNQIDQPEQPGQPDQAGPIQTAAQSGRGSWSTGWGRRPGPARPADERPTVVESTEVAGVAYSNGITRPFDQEPRSGQFPVVEPGSRPGAGGRDPGRWLRTSAPPGAAPESPPTGVGPARRLPRLGSRPRKLQRHPNAGAAPVAGPATGGRGLVTDPLGPRTDPYGFPPSALDRRLDADAAALVTARSSAGDRGVALLTGELVQMLHERVGELYGVSDTAQVLADDVIERADADSAAVLVPDGPIWRVSGGVGLRPLERRLVLEDSHWLITEIGSAGRAVLIEDTDIIRQQLAGAPLAAWRHLLAVPVPDVRAIVVLARGQEGGPFTDRDLSAVIAPVREAAPLLAQAIETRRLARMLGSLREQDGDAPPLRRPPY